MLVLARLKIQLTNNYREKPASSKKIIFKMTVTVHKVKEVLINNSNQDYPHKSAKNSYDIAAIITCLKTQLKVRQFRRNQKI